MRGSRRLGSTAVELPPLGQGTTRTGGHHGALRQQDRQRIRVLRMGIDLGMTLIDTAELYGGGRAEELVGRAITGIRDRVFLTSKFNPAHSSREGVMRAVEGSLRRLRTEYLDLYQIHWPNPATPLEETLGAMQDLVRQGKVRYLGVSNFTLDELKAARSAGMAPEIVSNQMEYNLFQRAVERDILPYCQRNGMPLLAYSPLDRGIPLRDARRAGALQTMAKEYGRTVAQVTLRWVLTRPAVIALVKSASAEHTAANAQITEFDLLDEDIKRIDALFEQRIIRVAPAEIRAAWEGSQNVYKSAEAALRNDRDLIPSPRSVAENVAKGNFLKPVPLVRSGDRSGTYRYDLVGDEILYWAWVIAKGHREPIPAYEKYPSH